MVAHNNAIHACSKCLNCIRGRQHTLQNSGLGLGISYMLLLGMQVSFRAASSVKRALAKAQL